jgi:hypothetical protein
LQISLTSPKRDWPSNLILKQFPTALAVVRDVTGKNTSSKEQGPKLKVLRHFIAFSQ